MTNVVPDADSLIFNAASQQYRTLQTSLQNCDFAEVAAVTN